MKQSIRLMTLEDIPQAVEIERAAFPLPWPATNFKRELTSHTLTRYMVACANRGNPANEAATSSGEEPRRSRGLAASLPGLGRFLGGRDASPAAGDFIVGFAGMWFMVDEAHLSNIAVRTAYRRRGVGESLLIAVIEQAVAENARFVTLEVRASNIEATSLYRKYGFAEVGVRRGYYTDNGEDAILLTVDAIGSPAYQDFLSKLKQQHARRCGLDF